MPITPDKTLVIYNSGDPSSLDFMTQYIKIRRIPPGNLYGIDTPTTDRYQTYEDFKYNLLDTVNNLIDINNYTCVLLGYRIPAGFIYNQRVYSCSSVISGRKIPFDGIPKRNTSYTVSSFEKFDSLLEQIPVCFSLDVRNAIQMKILINKINSNKTGVIINGSFYLDKYHTLSKYPNDEIYFDVADSFANTAKTKFNIDVRKTAKNRNSNIEPSFSLLVNDSIFWGWGDLIANESYFSTTATNRIVFMSYDNRSMTSLRTDELDNACMAAINRGYACVAGNLGDSSFLENELHIIDPYDPYSINTLENHVVPNPYSFMDAINSGRTVGEAFLYSKPYLHDSFVVIGDPLLNASIENSVEQEKIGAKELWLDVESNMSKSAAYMISEGKYSSILHERNLRSNDLDMKIDLSKSSYNLSNRYFIENRKNTFSGTFDLFQGFSQQINMQINAIDEITFRDFLKANNLYISRSIIKMMTNGDAMIVGNQIPNLKSEKNIYIDLFVQEMEGDAGYIHFEIDGSLDEDFDQIIFSFKSYEDTSFWKYEKTNGSMDNFEQRGIFSGLVGRRVSVSRPATYRYSLSGEELYIRYKQILNSYYESNYFYEVIIIP
jgi:hypothetical protein